MNTAQCTMNTGVLLLWYQEGVVFVHCPLVIDEMILIHVPFLRVNGMALFPFVLVQRPNPSPRLLNHERIHLRQQLELGIGAFYGWYLAEYLYRRWQLGNHDAAYRAISFEREAYANDHNLNYLGTRPWFAFWPYRRATQK